MCLMLASHRAWPSEDEQERDEEVSKGGKNKKKDNIGTIRSCDLCKKKKPATTRSRGDE